MSKNSRQMTSVSTEPSDITLVRKPAISPGDKWVHEDGSVAIVVSVDDAGVTYQNDGVAYEAGNGHVQSVVEFTAGRKRV